MNRFLLFSSVAAALTGSSFAASLSADFETDQSSSFTTAVAGSTNDGNVNFTYNSSTFTQQNAAGTVPDIPPAPTSTTENVARLNANTVDDTDVDAVVMYPNVTLSSHYTMTADLWGNYHGLGAGSGTTNFAMIGAAASNATAPRITNTITGDGAFFAMSHDGDSSLDYRFYRVVAGATASDGTAATWLGGAPGDRNSGDAEFTTYFPTPTFAIAGTASKAWVTFQLEVDGVNMTLRAKKPGDSAFTVLATATATEAADVAVPFIAFGDTNNGRPTPTNFVDDQFLLVDNFVVQDVLPPAAATNWNLYQ